MGQDKDPQIRDVNKLGTVKAKGRFKEKGGENCKWPCRDGDEDVNNDVGCVATGNQVILNQQQRT